MLIYKLMCVAAYLVAVGGMFYFLLTYEEPSHGRDEDQDDDRDAGRP